MAGRIITNTPSGAAPLPSSGRTISNSLDVSRTHPVDALDPEVVTGAELDATVGDQIRRRDTQIQFNPGDPDAFGASLPSATVKVAVTDDQGVIDKLSDIKFVQVDVDGGTAAGKTLKAGSTVGAVNGSIVVPLVAGEVEVTLVPTGNGTFIVGLSNAFNDAIINGASGKAFDTTDVATATFA